MMDHYFDKLLQVSQIGGFELGVGRGEGDSADSRRIVSKLFSSYSNWWSQPITKHIIYPLKGGCCVHFFKSRDIIEKTFIKNPHIKAAFQSATHMYLNLYSKNL